MLSPVKSSAQADSTSELLRFKGWLPSSQLLAVCAFPHRFPLSYDFGTLAGLGCFLFTTDVRTRRVSPRLARAGGIRSLPWFVKSR